MNVHLLIDAVVRQTTVLVAQLATSGGARGALGHTANQVFLELAAELRSQGLNNKLIADLFGLSLRTYHNKIRRLSESSTDRGRPLYNAVLEFVQKQSHVSRAEVLMRFCKDEEATVKSVLGDLVSGGFIVETGKKESLGYTAKTPPDASLPGAGSDVARENLVWMLIARHSPLRRSRLLELCQLSANELDHCLSRLLLDGRITRRSQRQEVEYCSEECVIPLGQENGWEASVFDHYQTVVTAICSKLSLGAARAQRDELIGGSTYSFEVWPGHPLEQEALGLLAETRKRAADLRARVDDTNTSLGRPERGVERVAFYVGQNVTDADDMDTEETPAEGPVESLK